MRHLNWTIKIGSDYKVFYSRQMLQFYLSKNLLHHHLDKKKLGRCSLTFCLITILLLSIWNVHHINTWLNECKCKNIGFASKDSMMRWGSCNIADWWPALCVWRWSHPTISVLLQITRLSGSDCQPLFQTLSALNMTSVCNVWSRMSAQKIVRFLTMSHKCLTKFTRERGQAREGTKAPVLLRGFFRSKFSIWCAFRWCCGWK